MLTAILFILILAVLILVHELGHFVTAKLFAIKVDEFGLGFPPRLFGKKVGETTYTLNAIPLGGFVKIFGEDGDEEDSSHEAIGTRENKRSFAHKPNWVKAIILVAGITMNIIFGYILISIGFMIGLPISADSPDYTPGTKTALVITSVLPDSPADKAGLIGGDVIIDASAGKNTPVTLSPDSVAALIEKSQTPVVITYQRGESAPRKATITPSDSIVSDRHAIGITMDMVGILKLSIIPAFIQGAKTSAQLIEGIVVGLWSFFGQLFTGQSHLSQVSGPIGIAKVVGQARSIGFVYVLSLVALISFNLAVINLVPIPALDGGRLFFIVIEIISRKKISAKAQQIAGGISFALLIILMIVISIHDVWGIL